MSIMPEIERELVHAASRRDHPGRGARRAVGSAVAVLVAAAAVALVVVVALGHHRGATTVLGGTPAPLGSPSHPSVLGCGAEAGIDTPLRRGPSDVVVGPLWFPGAKRLPSARPSGYGEHGVYKISPAIAAGATVTLTIAPSARSYAVMRNPYLARGVVSITYHACEHERSFFPQSFAFTDGRTRGCIPLDVSSSGRVRHITLKLFVRHCGQGTQSVRGGVVACHSQLHRAVLPTWARAGFSNPRQPMPFALGRSARVVAIPFGPLESPPAATHNNKILWVARTPARAGENLTIRAQRMTGIRRVGQPVSRIVRGGPGPSIINLPSPGCWQMTLRWSGHHDQLDLAYRANR
jgi:hypothetical protein